MKPTSQAEVGGRWSVVTNYISAMCLLALMFALALGEAPAATYYVATNGVDTNPGTQALPFKTIQHGIDLSTNGDTLQVTPGVYSEHLMWTNKSLALRGAGPGVSIIDGGQTGTCLELDYVPSTGLVADFTIQNGKGYKGGMVNLFSSPAISNCIFSGNYGTAGAGGMQNSHGNPTVTHCTFQYNTANDGAAMYNFSASPTVIDCSFVGNTNVPITTAQTRGAAMYNESSTSLPPSNPTLINCTFRNNNATFGAGIYSVFGSPTVINCTFSGNGRVTMFNSYGSRAVVINSIFWGNWSDPGQAAVISNSLPATVTYSDVQGGWQGIGNINADPLFIDAATGNLRLQPGSPCINAGSASVTSLPPTDLDGSPRIVGGAPDIGAFESTAGFWFVDRAFGNDVYPGTPAAPLQTVTRALNLANIGDGIYVKAGNYGNDRARITKSVHLLNWGDAGLARIGKP